MKRNKLPVHAFPMETFLQVQQEMPGVSLKAVNGDGLTPLELAQKYNRRALIKWLN
jgi:hypothetical protein